jgi:hypothetical protein
MHKSAMGRTINMDKLRAQNEAVRAVGNMNVNARGDTIDSNNEVINDSSKRVNRMYQNAMENNGRMPRRVEVPPEAIVEAKPPVTIEPDEVIVQPIVTNPPVVEEEPEFLEEELEFDMDDEELPVKEESKSDETKK